MAKPGPQRNPTIDGLKDRIARDPFSRAFLQLAEEYRKEGRYNDAIAVCLEGLQRHPTYHTARISLGRTYMEAGNLEPAKRAFSEVLELQPENHLAGKLLAEIQKKMGEPAAAAETYRAILRYYPGDAEVAALLKGVDGPQGQATPPAAAAATPAQTQPRPAPATTAPAEAAAHRPPGPPVAIPGPKPQPAEPQADPAPDFRAEGLGDEPFAQAREPLAAPPASAPVFRDVVEPDGPDEEDDALKTNTLAELYLRQGLVDRVVEVYRGMMRVDPRNQRAARRLAELQPGAPPAAPPARAAPEWTEATHDSAPSLLRTSDAAEPGALGQALQADTRRAAIFRLQNWLSTVRTSAGRVERSS